MFDFLIEKAIVFLPLIAAIITGFADKRLGDRNAQLLTSGPFSLLAASPMLPRSLSMGRGLAAGSC